MWLGRTTWVGAGDVAAQFSPNTGYAARSRVATPRPIGGSEEAKPHAARPDRTLGCGSPDRLRAPRAGAPAPRDAARHAPRGGVDVEPRRQGAEGRERGAACGERPAQRTLPRPCVRGGRG